jgi:hypothetical protein
MRCSPGYIAGVVNPMFAERMEWWDVLCDVATGKVTVNPNTMPQEKERLPHSKLDAEFYQRVRAPDPFTLCAPPPLTLCHRSSARSTVTTGTTTSNDSSRCV